MNIGKNIKKIREDNSMSQEQFGKIFFVTRQTVSNWENEKSYPDLNTIIKISDEFGISLDKLLKEDPEMVNTISEAAVSGEKWTKLRRVLLASACVLAGAAVIAGTVWGILWHNRKVKLETHFNEAVSELGFGMTSDGVYCRSEDGTEYTIPNQKMPSYWDLSLNFHADFVYGSFEQGDKTYEITYSGADICGLTVRDNGRNEDNKYIELYTDGTPVKPGAETDKYYSAVAERVAEVISVCSDTYDKVYI